MQMDIRLLEAFRAVMDTQSVTRAADILGVTQPAVSAQIARLEAQVGFALFARVGGRLKPTAEGRRFFGEVRNALGLIDRLGEVAEAIRGGAAESVVVATHPAASLALMPGVTAELLARRPDARVRMINRTSEEVRAIFESGAADLAVAEWPVHLPGLDLRRYEIPCVAVLPENHALAGAETVSVESLSGAPFVAMPQTRLIGHRIREAFVERGAAFEPVAESEYFSTICGLVAAGCGVSVVDALSARAFARFGLAVRRFAPAIRYEIAAFRRAGPAPGPLAEDLLMLIDRRLRAAEAAQP
jgi:DNA-binding transcriptional LysR family regulator